MNQVYLFVGSTNPVKINAVKIAVQKNWPQAIVEGFSVPSGVSAQPVTDNETKLGATNRARAALQAGQEKFASDPSFAQAEIVLGIGLEGGVCEVANESAQADVNSRQEMWSTVWGVVADSALPVSQVYATAGARFQIPEQIATQIRAGVEMGHAAAAISGIDEVKQKGGLIGILTDNFTDRTEEYVAIARLSLGIWYGRHWLKNMPKLPK